MLTRVSEVFEEATPSFAFQEKRLETVPKNLCRALSFLRVAGVQTSLVERRRLSSLPAEGPAESHHLCLGVFARNGKTRGQRETQDTDWFLSNFLENRACISFCVLTLESTFTRFAKERLKIRGIFKQHR